MAVFEYSFSPGNWGPGEPICLEFVQWRMLSVRQCRTLRAGGGRVLVSDDMGGYDVFNKLHNVPLPQGATSVFVPNDVHLPYMFARPVTAMRAAAWATGADRGRRQITVDCRADEPGFRTRFRVSYATTVAEMTEQFRS
eukprot:1811826-Pyramimonas_sp.AAC.1